MRPLVEQVILVTGATDGLGKAVAMRLARSGATLLLHGRDETRGQQTLEEIRAQTGNTRLHWYRADFSSLAQVRAMAARLAREQEHLDVLLNNVGIHMNLLMPALRRGHQAESEQERAAVDALATFRASGSGYLMEQNTRPQTIGQSLADTPVGLAAWLLDHDARSYEKMSHAFFGHPEGELTRDEILDNITLYWLTNTGPSAARLYWETKVLAFNASDSSVPVALTVFPDEYYRAPRSWAEWAYHNLIYFHEVDRGGHFAAWEQPELFSEEVRAGFRSLR